MASVRYGCGMDPHQSGSREDNQVRVSGSTSPEAEVAYFLLCLHCVN